jgi:cell division protein FtsQ
MELSLPLLRRPPRRTTRRGGGAGGGERAPTRAVHALSHVLDLLRGNRRALRATVAMLVMLPLRGGGWLWLRDSSFVAVRHVHITGVHGTEAIEIRTALDDAATRMTTMHFNDAALRSAVSSFAIVGALHVTTSFPHTVSISVSERPPVAALQSAGQRTAVAADGTVLGPAWLSSSLPLVTASVEPPAGERVNEASALAAVAVLGAAPAPLARFVVRVYNSPEGLTVAMRNGLLVYFGDASRPHAKWLSFARVLASPNAAGALYVDVRLPERPAAGFSAPSSSSSTSTFTSSTPVQAGASDPTAAALAARLSQAAGGSTAASTPTSAGESEASSSSSSSSAGESEASTASSGSGEGEAASSAPAASPQSEASSGVPSSAGGSEASSGAPAGSTPSGGEPAPGG